MAFRLGSCGPLWWLIIWCAWDSSRSAQLYRPCSKYSLAFTSLAILSPGVSRSECTSSSSVRRLCGEATLVLFDGTVELRPREPLEELLLWMGLLVDDDPDDCESLWNCSLSPVSCVLMRCFDSSVMVYCSSSSSSSLSSPSKPVELPLAETAVADTVLPLRLARKARSWLRVFCTSGLF